MRSLLSLSLIAVLLHLLWGCREEKHEYVANAGELTPTMTTADVVTFVSDSGYTRYKVTTRLWQMFEEAEDPFWRFPLGLELEQYDKNMRPEATIVCDSAKFFSVRGLWQLDGHVVAVNTLRDSFLTNQLFWNRRDHRVYSDSFVHIVRTDHILEGYGFDSDEKMTEYSLSNPTGIIPIERPATDSPQSSLQTDTTNADVYNNAPTDSITSKRQRRTIR